MRVEKSWVDRMIDKIVTIRSADLAGLVPITDGLLKAKTEAPSSGPSRAGFHKIDTLAVCPRKYAVTYIDNLQPNRVSPALAKGSMVHIAMAHHYGRMADRPWAIDPIDAMRQASADISWVFEEVRPIYEAYDREYRHEPFEVLDIEEEFEISVGGYDFTARLDLVVNQGGSAVIYESKTGSVLAGHREWQRNGQIVGQCVIGNALFKEKYGIPFGGIVINGIRTGEVRDFKRTPIEITDRQLQDWPKSIYYWYKLEEALRKTYGTEDSFNWPMSQSSCVGRYGVCSLYDACTHGKYLIADWQKRS